MNHTSARSLKTALWSAGMLLVHYVVMLAMLMLLLRVVPSYVKVYADFDMELPLLTQWTVTASATVAHYWYPLLSLVFGLDAVVFIGLIRLPPEFSWVRLMWFFVVLIALLICAVFTAVALHLPVQTAVEVLQ
ncbi:MAG: hypothetical protein JXB62_16730 [Pirellulales bacterium]|nr:hypothetical protein [Pirellulales bacterium]